MTLSARAIALQGFGFGALLVAVQGFATVEVIQPTPTINFGGGGGTWHSPRPVTHRLSRADGFVDDDLRAFNIKTQNIALIALVMSAAAQGEFV